MKLLDRRAEILLRYGLPWAAAGTLMAGLVFALAAFGVELTLLRIESSWFSCAAFGGALVTGGLCLQAASRRVRRSFDRKDDPTRRIRARLAEHLRGATPEPSRDDAFELQGSLLQ